MYFHKFFLLFFTNHDFSLGHIGVQKYLEQIHPKIHLGTAKNNIKINILLLSLNSWPIKKKYIYI